MRVFVNRRPWALALVACGLVSFAVACQTRGSDSTQSGGARADSLERAARVSRGQQAYLGSCAMCHGIWGEGDGPFAAQLEKDAGVSPARLNDAMRLSQLTRADIIEVIKLGGARTHRSNLMPPWASRLSPELIGDIADFVTAMPSLKPGIPRATIEKYLEAPPGTPEQGRRLFVTYCTMCHGPYGKGDGFMSDTLFARAHVRPRNLTDSSYIAKQTDKDLFVTVTLGGAYTGHSTLMPGWSVTLAPEQIKDVVSYIRAISKTASRP